MLSSELTRRGAAGLLLGLLAACGNDLQPYRGQPGGAAPRLALPPAFRIAVPPAQDALLSDQAAADLASNLAEALRARELPAAAANPLPLDWFVMIQARREGGMVVPSFTLKDADGSVLGESLGQPVPIGAWSREAPALLKSLAEAAATPLAGAVEGVEAARKATDTDALAGRGALRVRLSAVKGAPGDGNASLHDRLRDFMLKLGLQPQEGAEGATYAVQGDVRMVPIPEGKQRVEIQWIVTRRDGEELGRVVQLNEVPKGSLDGLWGDVAYVVAEQAAAGIRDVLRNATTPKDDKK